LSATVVKQSLAQDSRNHKKRFNKLPSKQSNHDVTYKLKYEFRKAMKAARKNFHFVYLDLFAGVQGISTHLKNVGCACLHFEVTLGPEYDLCNSKVRQLIRGWISSSCVAAVWLATPCTSWSRARHGPANSSWGPIRDNNFIYGLPNVSEKDKQKLRMGNATMRCTAQFIRTCIQNRVPVFLENPAHSMIWMAPEIKKCCTHMSHRSFITDFCQHGARWRKRTRISAWYAQPCSVMNLTCSGRKGLCSHTLKPHIILQGQDRKSKCLWTHIAQPYPRTFAKRAASWMIDSHESLRAGNFIDHCTSINHSCMKG
jgi:hypothetical protein